MHLSRNSQRHSSDRRTGFTLIELLVVISIIAVLMSLILPAIQNARSAARRTQCLNRVRQVGLAMHAYAAKHPTNRFPPYGTWGDWQNASGVWQSGGSIGAQMKSWVVDVLAELDRQDIFDRWDHDEKHDSTNPGADGVSNLNLIRNYTMNVLVCPDDDTAVGRNGTLSFVVNAGYAHIDGSLSNTGSGWGGSNYHGDNKPDLDLNLNGTVNDDDDRDLFHRTGVCWRQVIDKNGDGNPTPRRNASHTFDSVYDGLGNTIMVTENTNAGDKQSWGDPDPRNCAFVYPFDPDPTDNLPPLTAVDYFATAPLDPVYEYGQINKARGGPEGERPFPNSNHFGGVNIVMCDGSARFLDESVDLTVYARLISPAGSQSSLTVGPQEILEDSSF